MVWSPDRPDDTSRMEPQDFEPFVNYWIDQATTGQQYRPELIEHALDYFFQGMMLTFHRQLMADYILGQVETAKTMGLPWAHLLEMTPTNRMALNRLSGESLKYIKWAGEELKGHALPYIAEGLKRNINTADLGVMMAKTFTGPIPELGMSFQPYCVMVQRTEGAKMKALGRCDKLQAEGKKLCVITPHTGSCERCQKLIEGRVFLIQHIADGVYDNYGKKPKDWVGCCPLHPNCRHSPQPLVPTEEAEVMAKLAEMGLTLDTFPREGILLSTGGLVGKEADEFKEKGILEYEHGVIAPGGVQK